MASQAADGSEVDVRVPGEYSTGDLDLLSLLNGLALE